MAKVLKIVGQLFGVLFEWVIIVIILFAFFIRTSTVQTYLAQQAANFLSKELNTTIAIDEVAIVFIDRVALEGVLVLDQKKDTLASIGTLYVTLDKLDLAKNFIGLDRAVLEEGTIHLNRDSISGDYNYAFLADYFSSDKPSKKSKPFSIGLNAIELSSIDFKYDDFRKSWSEFGMDYDHLSLKNVDLSASNLSIDKEIIHVTVDHLSAKERCGFMLKHLAAKVTVSPKGLWFDQLSIQTASSKLTLPRLHFNMKDYSAFNEFVDRVQFDAQLNESLVSMKDIAYFAPDLEGMKDRVRISARVTNAVKNLKISNLDLRIGKRTVIQGDLQLPDFRDLDRAYFVEKLTYARVDFSELEAFYLPKSSAIPHIQLGEMVNRFQEVTINQLQFSGSLQRFNVRSKSVITPLGSVEFPTGVSFRQQPNANGYAFYTASAETNSLFVDTLQLGTFLDDPMFGTVHGSCNISGNFNSAGTVNFDRISGDFSRFDFLDYAYSGISVRELSIKNNLITGQLLVNDPNVKLDYTGTIDIGTKQGINATVDVSNANLFALGFTATDSTLFQSKLNFNIEGFDPDKMTGFVQAEKLTYSEGSLSFGIPNLRLDVARTMNEERFTLRSNLLFAELVGKVNFSSLADDFVAQFNKVFPSVVALSPHKKELSRVKKQSDFKYNVDFLDVSDVLAIFVPDLKIQSGTKLDGSYSGAKERFQLTLSSPAINYQDLIFQDVKLDQSLTSNSIEADYSVKSFIYSDSIQLDEVRFQTSGQNNHLQSELSWNPRSLNESKIIWSTFLTGTEFVDFTLRPSYFAINEMRWDILNESDITIAESEIHVSNFTLHRKSQFITLDGCLSKNESDKLNFKINDIDLNELGKFIGAPLEMEGLANGWGYISNPYTNLSYMGDAAIKNLFLNKREVGDIFVQSNWNNTSESIQLVGDLLYKGNQTFQFDGRYFMNKEENLDFNLVFDKTDIQFTNAFLDPDVVNNIRGLIDGKLAVKGSVDAPEINGKINLIGGNAKIEMLGVNFGFDGSIKSDAYGFYIDNMPVTDEEGNVGAMIGSIYHDQFTNWNFDLQFDLEPRSINRNLPYNKQNTSLDKFLVLNTQYKEGEMYFGKAFVTGTANINGYADNIAITVDVETKKGTTINFPMYGMAELEEEENSFITFKRKGERITSTAPRIDFTGVELDLNFRVTPEAKLKIIFNDQTGDEISATGSGDISMKIDNLGDLMMDGTFKIKEGSYNFAMASVIKQPFHIEEGGVIAWTGDPLNATLDMRTYYEVNANLSEVSPNELQSNSNGTKQKVYCYLGLTESLLKPTIGFDIKVPKADETGKALLARITSDKDELNRQFFSLLLWKRFQPLRGTAAAGGSAAMDLVSNQINSMLSQVSKEYKMNVNLDTDETTKESTYEFGVSKGFLDDRLILTGSFGVESTASSTEGTAAQNALIGDVSLEYLVNESGTVRINVFNESNDNSIINDKNLGLFTQGAGLRYQEDFDHFGNFKLAQYFLDIFRKKSKKKYPVKRKRQQSPVPKDDGQSAVFILPEILVQMLSENPTRC